VCNEEIVLIFTRDRFMRRGEMKAGLIIEPIIDQHDGSKSGGRLIGLSLGYDHCAEHEMGIDSLRNNFEIPTRSRKRTLILKKVVEIAGAEARTITQIPDGLHFFESVGGAAYLVFNPIITMRERWTEESLLHWLRVYDRDEEFSAAWSSRDFGVRMKNSPSQSASGTMILGQIYEAMKRKDAMLYLTGGGPFGGAGLLICIRSHLSQETIGAMLAADRNALDIADEVEKIESEVKLKARLMEAEKKYYVLSPTRPHESEAANTAYKLIFWLNPHDRMRYHSRWCTVEELLEWVEDKGPIVRTELGKE
jgi:hypothetical protein